MQKINMLLVGKIKINFKMLLLVGLTTSKINISLFVDMAKIKNLLLAGMTNIKMLLFLGMTKIKMLWLVAMSNIKMLLLLGMTKIKMMKEEAGSADFVEKRRASLERYSSLINIETVRRAYETNAV